MAGTATLYTRDVLALAASLSEWPHDASLPLQGTARSATCGSTLELGLDTDAAGRIVRLGLKAQACAIGQASAALFARIAPGRDQAQIAADLAALRSWMDQSGSPPDWPDFPAIAAARDYPARHGAITLAWQAALAALASAGKPG